jgi:hypothetical protein
MKEKIIELLEKYGKLFVLFCITVSAFGIVFSYVFPKEKPYGIDVNIEEGSEFNIPLTKGEVVEYKCNTGTKPMAGIQLYVSKQGAEFTDGKIKYEVYNSDGTKLLSSGEQLLKDISDVQFVYFEFGNKKECNGDLVIKFSFEGSETTVPALIANKKVVEDASTSVNGSLITGNIKSSYIYVVYTHPLVFDLKVMLAIFVTVFFTLESKRSRK